ncbi:peptidoglycan-associated lipoprotein [Methylophilaceae bacterium]|nr:peptidoglycan-associated lipoprotein [Methylophilaceae bacterium]
MASHPKAKMTLTGNTDDRGSREYNVSLGQKRSVSVKKSMNVLGAQDTQIETVSFGEERAETNCKMTHAMEKIVASISLTKKSK